jgi:hypothetical protein
MVPTLDSCRKYGDHAALLAIIPGLGHFRNRQFLIGILSAATIGVLLLWVFWLAIWQFGSQHSNLGLARACFLFWTLVVWQASVVHVYYSTIRQRQQHGSRQPVELPVQIAASGLSPCYGARTRNLSRTGACLVVSNALPVNTQLTLAFDGQPTRKARVIWSKSAGSETGTLVGVEFERPLASLLSQRAA